MAEHAEEWSTDANEAMEIALVQPVAGAAGALKPVHRFPPRFTYPIYGEEERIFGYKGLAINLAFAAHDVRPLVSISYDEKFKAVGSTQAQDLQTPLREFLPSAAFETPDDFERAVRKSSADKDFNPPGTHIKSYERHGQQFEIWAGSLLDPDVREAIDRMQILVSLFIEAGTPIPTSDVEYSLDRWRVYFVYEKADSDSLSISPYTFVGYATTYRFYNFILPTNPPSSETVVPYPPERPIAFTELPSRLRISQFLVLPPYQTSGHGSALYQAVYAEVMADATIRELTVEDPSEEFDKLRDTNDWKVLEPAFREAGIGIDTSISDTRIKNLPTAKLLAKEKLEIIRTSHKIASRQFARQLEMYLLSLIPYSHRAAGGANLTRLKMQKQRNPDLIDRSYYWWRLIVKQRIFKRNKDVLQQMDLEDRLPKIEETARALEDEYEQLLLAFVASLAKELLQNGNGAASASSKERKRKVVEDDEDAEDGTAIVDNMPERKKLRP